MWDLFYRDSKSKALPQIEQFTTNVIAKLDVEFGLIINIKKAKGEKLHFCIYHPDIPDSNGEIMPPFEGVEYIKENDWQFYLGDTLWEPIENKLGDWRMTLTLNNKIIADKKIELIERKAARPLESFKHQAKPTTRSFYQALAAPGTQFILECKKASPSKGLIRQPFDLTEITQAYKQYATCMSVLTDEKYFQGSFDYLAFVRSQVEQPLICKDFFIDEYQVYMARIYGGDAILLMLSVLDDEQYKALHAVADSLNMSVLTEVSNEEEVHRALALNAQIIGINNRDLRDLSTDLATTERLRKLIPSNKVVISESGIYTHQDVKRLAPLCNGFLIGSSLMAEADLLQACRRVILGENKVCGLTRNQDAIAAYNNGAVYGGLIFYPKSPRFVDLDCAKEISQSAPLKFVGVFVNAAIAEVTEHANQLKLSAVQLHGQEDEHYIASLLSLIHI